jgi:hypothetical protein
MKEFSGHRPGHRLVAIAEPQGSRLEVLLCHPPHEDSEVQRTGNSSGQSIAMSFTQVSCSPEGNGPGDGQLFGAVQNC